MGNLAYKRSHFAAWFLRRGDKKIMGLYVQVSKSLELARIKTARDFRNVQKVIDVEHWSSVVNWTVVVREAEGQEEVKEGDRSCNQLCKRASKIKYKKETDPQKSNSIAVHWYPNELKHLMPYPTTFPTSNFTNNLPLSPIFLLRFSLSVDVLWWYKTVTFLTNKN